MIPNTLMLIAFVNAKDPVLFTGTIRFQLDPFCQYSDGNIWDVLEQVSALGCQQFYECRIVTESTILKSLLPRS